MKRYGVLHPYPLPSLWRSSPGWLRNFPGLITASRFLWDFCKIPQKSSFFVILGWRRQSSPARRSSRLKFYSSISEDFNLFYYRFIVFRNKGI